MDVAPHMIRSLAPSEDIGIASSQIASFREGDKVEAL